MHGCKRSWLRSAVILAAYLIMPLTISAGEELNLPENLFFYQPVASIWGQSSVWINPAGLSTRQTGRMLLMNSRSKRLIRDWGFVSTLKFGGAAYRKIKVDSDKDINEYIFAVGGGRRTSYGFSYRYIKDGPGHLNKRHLWNIGFLSRYNRNMAFGARVENLNRSKIDGEKTEIRYVYGLAARAYKNRLTVTFDVNQLGKESLRQADFRTGIEIRPKPGLYLYADFDNHSRFNAGIRLNFGTQYAGHYHNFDRNGKSLSSTTYIGSIEGRQSSLLSLRKKTLSVHVSGRLPENPKIPYLGKKPLKFFDFIDGIYRAAEDKSIDRLYLQIGSLRCGMGKTEELSEAVKYFRSQGKPVIAHLASPTNLGYLLAASADTVLIPPVSQLSLVGLQAELQTYKGLLDKIGVEAEMERVEEYKTAPERFILDRPSEPNRQQINRILDGLYDQIVGSVAENRNMSPDSVRTLIDSAPMTSVQALQAGLVDDTCYVDYASAAFAGSAHPIYSHRISLSKYLRPTEFNDRWGETDRLALIIAEGDITAGKSGGRIGEYEMLSAIKRARQDRSVKGVVLRVNSPGGSALASDLIWHEIEETIKAKPLIISMGNVAASGGYYISAVNGPIFVNRSTITGSIGVYAGKVNLSRLYDKIGIYSELYTRGRNAGMYSLAEPFTPAQRTKLKAQINDFYRYFIGKVAQARSLSTDSINALGRGQVWTGIEAIGNGLADSTGGLYQAIESLHRQCGLKAEDTEIITLPRKYFLFDNPFDFQQILAAASERIFGTNKPPVALDIPATDQIYFRMPYNIVIE
ncbi:MAG: signal peptide peptidase SppA [FCB group bacterium]|nr:signal peptide peptidase SppA [FCB group bacterium]